MISGTVVRHEARVSLRLRGPGGRERRIDAVIDTGYTGFLTLSLPLVADLALSWQSLGRGTLADGSECLFDVYLASVYWDRKWQRILIDETNAQPLVGMALLQGYELKMSVVEGGRVRITKIG
jgi:clan AA aspartic protease